MFSNILEKIDLLKENRDEILDIWLSFEIVQSVLTDNGMNVDFFKRIFAQKALDNCIKIIESKSELGSCPVTNIMLKFFKNKDISLSDLYMIYAHLKNSLLLFLQKKSILDSNTLTEIALIIDYNLDGIICEYVETHYNIPNNKPTRTFIDTVQKDTPAKTVLSSTQDKAELISARDYIQEINIDNAMIDELEELEEDAINSIAKDEEITSDSIIEASTLINKYSKVLNMTFEFDELSYTLTVLRKLLLETDFLTLDIDTSQMIQVYLIAIIDDLRKWRISIFIYSDAEDIHYLDKTLLSSIAQLEITLAPPKDFSDENEIDFF